MDELILEFEVKPRIDALPPQYNIAPTDEAPIVVQTRERERRLGMARFGLVPHWAKDPRRGVKMLNARVETVASRPAFRDAFLRRRCLVVADGFYEWRRAGKKKIPYRFGFGGRPFGMAGLWSVWRGERELSSFTILTRPALGATAAIHDRMPIILPRAQYGRWLDRAQRSHDTLHEVLDSHLGAELLRTRVSERVNSVRNNDDSLLEEVPERELFG